MSDLTSNSVGGIGFGGLLAILFIGLKLTHVINWSWWWVLSPLWIPLAVVILILLIALFFLGGATGLISLLDRKQAKNRRKTI